MDKYLAEQAGKGTLTLSHSKKRKLYTGKNVYQIHQLCHLHPTYTLGSGTDHEGSLSGLVSKIHCNSRTARSHTAPGIPISSVPRT